jgi:hypothetical protein
MEVEPWDPENYAPCIGETKYPVIDDNGARWSVCEAHDRHQSSFPSS